MSLTSKTAQNLQLAEYCLTTCLFSPGISRAYYATYQHVKSYLMSHGVTDENYKTKAAGWGVDFQKVTNHVPFGHETIWQALKLYLKASRQGTALQASTGEKLRDKRVMADYEDADHVEDDLVWSIRVAKGFIQSLR